MTGRRLFSRVLLVAALAPTLSGCADEAPPPVEVVERVYYADAHDSEIELEPGERFAVALPTQTKVRWPFRRAPRRARVDGKVLTLKEMGSIPKAWQEAAGGPGTAYVFEVLDNGRSQVTVDDAAHRERFRLRVKVGDAPTRQRPNQHPNNRPVPDPFKGEPRKVERRPPPAAATTTTPIPAKRVEPKPAKGSGAPPQR